MADNNKNNSPTEINFDFFLSDDENEKQAAEISRGVNAVDRSLDDEFRSVLNDVSSIGETKPEGQAKAISPAQTQAEPEDEFEKMLNSSLRDMDDMIDVLYSSEPPKPAEPVKAVPADDFLAAVELPDSAAPVRSTPGHTPAPAYAPAPKQAPARQQQVPAGKGVPAKEKAPKKKKKSFAKSFFPAKGDSAGEIVRKMVLMASVLTIVISGCVLVNTYYIEPHRFAAQAVKAADDLLEVDDQGNMVEEEELSQVVQANPDVKYPEGMNVKYKKLYAINNDVAGWLSIPGLDINFPLAQGSNNTYYLKRDIYGKRTKYGVPFFDYRNSLHKLNKNTIVYGHNMSYDNMIFGNLENYRTLAGFKSAPVIECNTIFGDYKWKVYAVFVTNGRASGDNGYVFNYNFIDLDEYNFFEYIKQIDQRKLYTTGVDILSTDKILTLSTCSYDFDESRLVVVARLVRDGESVDVQVSNAVLNNNPRYPQAWYDAQGKTNPYAGADHWVAS